MENTRWPIFIFILVFLVVLGPSIMLAGTTGKIAGVVTDKSSGEGLPGPNIEIVGTSLGAAADVNGMFVVLMIPPGKHTVRVSMLGYSTVELTDVVVNIDRVTQIEVELQEANSRGRSNHR